MVVVKPVKSSFLNDKRFYRGYKSHVRHKCKKIPVNSIIKNNCINAILLMIFNLVVKYFIFNKSNRIQQNIHSRKLSF